MDSLSLAVSGLQLVHEADETAPLSGGDAARDCFGDNLIDVGRETVHCHA
jgi:hypothetical protein